MTLPYKASDIEERVTRIVGVKGVQNTITLLPVSSFDDRLRLGIARALYTDPALSMYGLGANPSIHVIVEYGRVTLDGVVNNEMDKAISNSVARACQAFGVTNELKTSDEVEQRLAAL